MGAPLVSSHDSPDDKDILKKIFESYPDGLVVSNAEGKIVDCNPQLLAMFGYERPELVGQMIEMLLPERFRAAHPRHRSNYGSAPRMRSMGIGLELFGLRKNGSEFPVDIMLNTVETENGTFVLSVVRDITQQKQLQQAVITSEKHLRALFEFSPDAIVTSNSDGLITDLNSQAERFFGYSRGELLGQSVDMLVPERFRHSHPTHRHDYNAHPRTRPMGAGLELQGRRKDGTEFPIDIMLAPIQGPDGVTILSTIRDISERKQAEEAIRRAEHEKKYLEEELHSTFDEIVGESPAIKSSLKQVETVAPMDATVLVLGETGTGKELIARAIHRLSRRSNRTFVKLNCAAIPSGLLESELFGHEKGAFTGAIAQKIGRLELAHKGTLFLDEVGDIPLELQPKLLRALQEKEFERLGSTRTISVDIRLIAATNRNLEKMVADGTFRRDLYYRLKVFPIGIPPLRERPGDIALLVRYFVHMHARRMDKHIETIPTEVMNALTHWSWPGNVRELENFIERAVILTSGTSLWAPLAELQSLPDADADGAGTSDLEATERQHILRVLRDTKGVIGGPGGAAERLGLKRTTLNSKMKKLGIERKDYS